MSLMNPWPGRPVSGMILTSVNAQINLPTTPLFNLLTSVFYTELVTLPNAILAYRARFVAVSAPVAFSGAIFVKVFRLGTGLISNIPNYGWNNSGDVFEASGFVIADLLPGDRIDLRGDGSALNAVALQANGFTVVIF